VYHAPAHHVRQTVTYGDDAVIGPNGWNPSLQGLWDRPSVFHEEAQTSEGPKTLGGVVTVLPFAQFPPPSAARFNQRVTNVNVPGLSTVDSGIAVSWQEGVLCAFNYYEVVVNNPLSTQDVFWTFLFNGSPIPGLDRIRTAAVTAAAAVFGDNPFLVLGQSGELNATVTNLSVGAFNINTAVVGWTFSAIEARNLSGSSRYAMGI
jgi:hypothetical protein